ncbi:MAG: PaaI family thioesterase, partial [Hyphomicrobiaceae bacterium]
MQPRVSTYLMRLDVAEVTRLVNEHFPQVHEGPGQISIAELTDGCASVRLGADPAMLRPGGTVSGPTMFKLADFTIYAALLGHLGDYALQAVTTSMTMNFLSRPAPADLIAQARL